MFKSSNWKLIIVALTIIILLAIPGYSWMNSSLLRIAAGVL